MYIFILVQVTFQYLKKKLNKNIVHISHDFSLPPFLIFENLKKLPTPGDFKPL